MAFYIGSSLVVRWDIQRRGWWGRGARNLHQRAGQIWLGLSLDGGGGFTGRAPGNQRPPTSRVCGGWVKGWGPVWHLMRGHDLARASHVYGPTSAYCDGLVPKRPKLQPWDIRTRGLLACPSTSRRQHTKQDGIPACQPRECPPGLLLPGWGVSWGTLVFPHCHLCSCALHPSGHEAVVSPHTSM